MGCNCKVTKKISYINSKYGDKLPQKKTNIVGLVKNTAIRAIVILCLPLILLHVLYVAIFTKDKKITFSKLFGKKKQ